MQRERTRKLKLRDFIDYFGLPIGEASQKLSLCPTVVKKICRKHGVKRWPYRKVSALSALTLSFVQHSFMISPFTCYCR